MGAIAHLLPRGLNLSDPPAAFLAAGEAFDGQGREYILLIDDIHLLDSTSATLVGQLIDSGRIFVIGTLRSDVVLSEAALALDRTESIAHVALNELSQDGVEEVLSSVLGGVVERRTSYELHRYSKGNLLFLRELVLGLVHASVLTRSGGLWRLVDTVADSGGTPRLRQLVHTRLSRMEPEAMKVLETLAVAEPLGLHELTRFTSPQVITTLEKADLIHVHASQRRLSASLAHPLYGEVLRGGMATNQRVEILTDCAQRILSHGAQRLDDVLRVATWQLEATGTADPDLIVQAAELARYSHDYDHVLNLLERLPADRATHATRLLLGEAYYLLHRFDDSERILKESYETAPDMAERLRVTIERTQNLFWAARADEALQINTHVLAATTDPAAQAALRINEGAMRVFAGQTRQGTRLLESVDETPEERLRLYASGMRALGLSALGRTEEAVELATRTRSQHIDASKRIAIQHPSAALSVLSFACAARGDLAGSQRAAERGHREAVADNATQPAAWLSYDMGRAAWLQGRIADAHRWFTETLALGLGEGIAIVLRPAAAGLTAAAAVLGRTQEAEEVLADLETYPDVFFLPGEDSLGKAWLLAARGMTTAACQVLFEAAGRAREAGAVTSEMMLLTEVARLGAAARAAGRLAELAHDCDGAYSGPQLRFAQAMARQDSDALLAAAGDLEQIGALLIAAEAAAASANLYQREGKTRRATAAANISADLAESCQGAVTPGLLGLKLREPLSNREREVATLAAAGAPSRKIAEQLHVSTRTIDNHLQRIYTKLGITSRRELAHQITPKVEAATTPRG
ncbi:LuxR C-terminal-related transcriptional regulator [Streptomyces cacaoi]